MEVGLIRNSVTCFSRPVLRIFYYRRKTISPETSATVSNLPEPFFGIYGDYSQPIGFSYLIQEFQSLSFRTSDTYMVIAGTRDVTHPLPVAKCEMNFLIRFK